MSYETLESQLLAFLASPGDDATFNTLALAIHRFQRERNLPYRRYCESLAAPEQLTDWRAIPAVPTRAFRHAALRTFRESEIAATFHTSGTTGEGHGIHDFRSLRLYETSIRRMWAALQLPPLPLVLLTQRPTDAPRSSLCHMMGVLAADSHENTWCIDRHGALDRTAFQRAVASGPVALLGTALAFLHLFESLGDSALPLAPGSYAMETGGYKGTRRTLSKPDLYALFAQKLALPAEAIWNEYSMTELSSQWFTRGLGRPHTGPAWARSLVVNPTTGNEVAEGETGVLRLFDLANLGSVLALQTQDLAIRRGRDFELIGRAPGAIPRGCSRSADELLSSSSR